MFRIHAMRNNEYSRLAKEFSRNTNKLFCAANCFIAVDDLKATTRQNTKRKTGLMLQLLEPRAYAWGSVKSIKKCSPLFVTRYTTRRRHLRGVFALRAACFIGQSAVGRMANARDLRKDAKQVTDCAHRWRFGFATHGAPDHRSWRIRFSSCGRATISPSNAPLCHEVARIHTMSPVCATACATTLRVLDVELSGENRALT